MIQSATKKAVFSRPLKKRKRKKPKEPINLDLYRFLDLSLTKSIAKLAHSEIIDRYKDILTNTWNRETRATIIRALNDIGAITGPVSQAELDMIAGQVEAALGEPLAAAQSKKIIRVDQGNWINTRRAVERELGVTLGWMLPDRVALDLVSRNTFFWIGTHYERFVQDRIEGRLTEYFTGGLNRRDLMLRLRLDFESEFKRSDSYWDLLADHTATKVREISRIANYQQAGVTVVRVKAQLDDRTTDICRSLHGTVIDVEDLDRQFNAIMRANDSQDPDKVKAAQPWWTDKQVERRLKTQNDVQANIKRGNIGFPPYHARCRTRTVAEFVAEPGDRVLTPEDKANGAIDLGRARRRQTAAKPTPKPTKIPRTLGAVKTIKDAERYAAARHAGTAFEFEGAAVETIVPTLRQYDKLARQFPEVAERIAYVGTLRGAKAKELRLGNWRGKNRTRYAWAWDPGDPKRVSIALNPAYYGDAKRFKDSKKLGTQTGWKYKGGDAIETTMTHEFGHHVENYFKSTGKESITPAVRASGGGLVFDMTRAFFKKWDRPDNLALYARHNQAEGWATAFEAGIHGTATVKKNPYIKAQKKFIKAMRGERFNIDTGTAKFWREASDEAREKSQEILDQIARETGVKLE